LYRALRRKCAPVIESQYLFNLNDKGRRRYACDMKHTGSLAGFCLTSKTQLAETGKKEKGKKEKGKKNSAKLLFKSIKITSCI